MKELTIITSASRDFEFFIEPFIHYSQISNDCNVEVWVEDVTRFKDTDTVKFHSIPSGWRADDYRFIAEPTFKTTYYYITDVDIMILKDVVNNLKPLMTNKYFSNIVRPNTKRLTGLMFCTNEYFDLTRATRQSITRIKSDECTLYEIVNRSIGVPEELQSKDRPLLGIHLSLNRVPFKSDDYLSWVFSDEELITFFKWLPKHRFNTIFKFLTRLIE